MAADPSDENGNSEELADGIVAHIPDGSTIPDGEWTKRHKFIVGLVLAHIPVLLGLGVFEGTESFTGLTAPAIPAWRIALSLGLIGAFAGASLVPSLNRRVRTVLAVTGLAFCSGTLVHFSGGYIEAHFHFFVAIGVAAIYEDWLPFGIGIGYVVLTHGIFGMVDASMVYNHQAAQLNPWVWGFIHGGFVTMLAGALTIHLSSIEKSRKQAKVELERAKERSNEIADLNEKQAEIEQQKEEAERLKEEAEAQRQEVEALNAHLELKAMSYQEAMEEAAAGDLTVRVDTDSDNEAMSDIGMAFNEMVSELEDTVGVIKSHADDVEVQVNTADSSTAQIAEASDDMTESVERIAAGTDEQRQMLDQVAEADYERRRAG